MSSKKLGHESVTKSRFERGRSIGEIGVRWARGRLPCHPGDFQVIAEEFDAITPRSESAITSGSGTYQTRAVDVASLGLHMCSFRADVGIGALDQNSSSGTDKGKNLF